MKLRLYNRTLSVRCPYEQVRIFMRNRVCSAEFEDLSNNSIEIPINSPVGSCQWVRLK